jgi:LmbE family N-acetylglucosaminyl deacetylase
MTDSSHVQRALRIMGVFAHPDDEVFCASGTFAKYAAAGAEIMVISATRGQAGQIRDARIATRRTLGQAREAELHLSAERLGIQHSVCWDYGDGTLRDLDPEALVRDVVAAMRSFRPDVVVSFGPDGGYGHPDHVAISAVTTEAFRQAGDGGQFPEQIASGLAPHQPARLYHSYFPRSRLLLLERLVQWLVQHPQRFRGTKDFLQALMLFSEETTMLGYASDYVAVSWFPAGFYIIEQGEPPTNLYLILSGTAEAIEEAPDGTLTVVNRLVPGMFFGERGLAYRHPRLAHVVAAENVTCLVFSPSQPTEFAGRGAGATLAGELPGETEGRSDTGAATTCIDVMDYVTQKMNAMCAHRTQFPLEPDMLPLSLLQEMFGQEYFIRVYPATPLETELL